MESHKEVNWESNVTILSHRNGCMEGNDISNVNFCDPKCFCLNLFCCCFTSSVNI